MNEFWKDYYDDAFYEGQPAYNRYQNSPVSHPEIVIVHDQESNDNGHEAHHVGQRSVFVHIVRKPAIIISAEKPTKRSGQIYHRCDLCNEYG